MPRIIAPKPRQDLEGTIQADIRLRLGLEADLVLFRNSQAVMATWDEKTGKSGMYRGGLGNGSADLVGILRCCISGDTMAGCYLRGCRLTHVGRWFCIEVKRPGQKPDADQVAWLALVRRFGGFATWVDSVESAVEALERARKGALE